MNRRRIHLPNVLATATSILAALALAQAAPAQSTNWIAGSADWSTSGNWDNGVPGSAYTATISNGGTATINGAAVASLVYVGGDNGGSGSLVLNSGSLNLTNGVGNNLIVGPVPARRAR